MTYQLKLGKKVEKEHSGTYAKIKAGKIKTPNKFYESVAKEHLKEDKNYYSKLKKLSLMIGIFSILTFMLLSINMVSAVTYVLQITPNISVDYENETGSVMWISENYTSWINGTNIFDGDNNTFGYVNISNCDALTDDECIAGYNLTYILPDNVNLQASQIYYSSDYYLSQRLIKINLTSSSCSFENNRFTIVPESYSVSGFEDNETQLWCFNIDIPSSYSYFNNESGDGTLNGAEYWENHYFNNIYEVNIMWAINETAPAPATPSVTSNAIYKTFEGTGSGVAIFLDYIKVPMALIILVLGVVAGIVYIIFVLKDVIVWKFRIGVD